MRKIKRFCLNALCVMLVIATLTPVASAVRYLFYNNGVANPVISVDNQMEETAYYYQAVDSWNATNTDVSITTSSSALSFITDGEFNDTWWGLYTPMDINFFTQHAGYFIIRINDAEIDRLLNYKRGVVAHEFGHAFCLNDNPSESTPNASVMNYNRDRSVVYGPTSDDVAGVNYAYR